MTTTIDFDNHEIQGPTVTLGTLGSYDTVNVPLDELSTLIERLTALRDSIKSQ